MTRGPHNSRIGQDCPGIAAALPRGTILRLAGMLWAAFGLLVMAGQSSQPANGVFGGAAVGATAPAENVAVITIKGAIDAVMAESVARRMQMAEKGGANAIVFEIDTPGGEVPAVLDICHRIKDSPIPNTVAWVNNDAYSGGAIIALACREIVVSKHASLGDAAPILVTPVGMQPLPATERSKQLSPIMAEIVDSARRNGYDEFLVQGMVSLGVELWLIEEIAGEGGTRRRAFIGPKEYEVIFGGEPDRSQPPSVASGGTDPLPAPAPPAAAGPPDPSFPVASDTDPAKFVPASEGLAEIASEVTLGLGAPSKRPVFSRADRGKWRVLQYVTDGKTLIVLKSDQMRGFGLARAIVANDTELMAYFGAKNLKRLPATWSERLASQLAFLTHPLVRFVLIFLFLVSLFLELMHPGVVLPGSIAAAALVALLAPPLLTNMANWWEIGAVAVGILLLAVELFLLPGFGVAGVAGLLLLLSGLLGTFVRETPGSLFPNSPEQRSQMFFGLVTIVMAMATSGVALYYVSRHFGSIPLLDRLVLRNAPPEEASGDEMLAAMASAHDGMLAPGTAGVALTPLRPSGRAQIGDRIIDVVADMGYIEQGARIRVVRADAFRVAVEPADPDGGMDEEGPGGAAA